MATILTPAQLVDNLMRNTSPRKRAEVLGRAREANESLLKQLNDQRLADEEKGWADDWLNRHQRTTDTLAQIKQALATC